MRKYGIDHLLNDIAFSGEFLNEEKTRETSCQNRATNRYVGYHLAVMDKIEKLLDSSKKETILQNKYK